MGPKDVQLLDDMRRAIAGFRSRGGDIGSLADHLLMLRDQLRFEDRGWFNELTQHIVTLDSASTYVPANDEQARQSDAATMTAIDAVLRLIEDKSV